MKPKDNETESLRRERGGHEPDLPDSGDPGEHSQTAFGRGTFAEPEGEARTTDDEQPQARPGRPDAAGES